MQTVIFFCISRVELPTSEIKYRLLAQTLHKRHTSIVLSVALLFLAYFSVLTISWSACKLLSVLLHLLRDVQNLARRGLGRNAENVIARLRMERIDVQKRVNLAATTNKFTCERRRREEYSAGQECTRNRVAAANSNRTDIVEEESHDESGSSLMPLMRQRLSGAQIRFVRTRLAAVLELRPDADAHQSTVAHELTILLCQAQCMGAEIHALRLALEDLMLLEHAEASK